MCREAENALVAFAYEKITATGSAASLTSATYQPTTGDTLAAQRAIIYVDTAAIRIRYDKAIGSGDPTTTDGLPVASGGSITIDGIENIKRVRVIAQTGSPVLNIVYLR